MSAIFLSHSSKDNAAAAEMKERLGQQGHRSLFLDFDPADGIPAGRDWEQELYNQLRACRAFIILCSEHSMSSPWCFAEITHAKALGKYVIPVKVEACTINPILTSRQVLDLTQDREEAYGRLFQALKSAGLDPQDAFDWDGSRPPYPGLLSFAYEDAAVFFGRDREIQDGLDVLSRLQHFGGHRLVMVFGASGSGKSSFVRAGLLPRLERNRSQWLIVPPFRPLGNPLQELSLVLAQALAALGVDRNWRDIRDMLHGSLAGSGKVLLDFATDLRASARQPQATVLLVIDQLEEIFGESDGAETQSFLSELLGALQAPSGSLMTIGTMRSDFLSEFQQHPELSRLPYEAMHIGSMPVEGFAQVIEGPAQVAGIRLGPGLTQALVEDAKNQDALPLLAFSLRELFDRYGSDGLLTLEEYRAGLGSLDSSVARRADSVLAAKALSDVEEKGLRTAFLAMVRVNEEGQYARQIARWSDLPAHVHEWLEYFVQAHLLVSRGEKGERTLEVAHEALFRSWERLSKWLTEEREFLLWRKRLRVDLAEWERIERDKGALLRGAILAEAAGWLDRGVGELTQAEQEYIRASLDQQAEEEQRWKHLYEEAEQQRQTAVEAQGRATRALAESRARELVLHAEASIEKDPQLSLMLGIEAAKQARDTEGTAMASVASLLRRAILATPRRLAEGISGIECFAISPTGTSIALGTQSRGVVELSLQDGATLREYSVASWVDTIDWSPDGSLLAAGMRDDTVIIWDVQSGKSLRILNFEYSPQSVHWRMATRQLAIGLANSDASPTKVYDYDKKRELFEVRGMRAAWSPDGKLLATGGGDGTVYIYTDSGQQLAALPGHERYVHKVVWHPDGRRFATASVDGYVIVWDVEGHRQLARLQNEFALSAAWSLDGQALASGAGTQFVTVWETNSFSEIFKITKSETITGQKISRSGAAGYVLDVAWGPGGKSFIVADREGGILVYSAGLLVSKTDDEWLATAQAQVQRSLTPEEHKRFGLGDIG